MDERTKPDPEKKISQLMEMAFVAGLITGLGIDFIIILIGFLIEKYK